MFSAINRIGTALQNTYHAVNERVRHGFNRVTAMANNHRGILGTITAVASARLIIGKPLLTDIINHLTVDRALSNLKNRAVLIFVVSSLLKMLELYTVGHNAMGRRIILIDAFSRSRFRLLFLAAALSMSLTWMAAGNSLLKDYGIEL